MIDIKFLRENPEVVKENIKKKFQDEKLPLVDEVIALDAERRAAQQEADDLKAEKNKISKQIGALMAQGKKEEPFTAKGDGETPLVEVDGVKYTYLICADYTSNKYAYNGAEADIFLNPSYDWQAFQYFTSYGVQARAIECGFSVLRNPVNGNIILYDYYGRPLHMANAMNVHTGILYLDIPREGRQTFYEMTGNWFPWICAVFSIFAVFGAFIYRKRNKN